MNQEQNLDEVEKLEKEAETVVSEVRAAVSETVDEAEQLIETTAERAEERLEEAAEKIEETEDMPAEKAEEAEDMPAEKAEEAMPAENTEETEETSALLEPAADTGSRPRVIYSNSKSEARKLAEKAGQAFGTAVTNRESTVSRIKGLFADPDTTVSDIVRPGNLSFIIIAAIIACAARFVYRLIYMLHYNSISIYNGFSALRMIGEIPLSILYVLAETALLALISWILFKAISGRETDFTANLAAASFYPLVLAVYFLVSILQVLIPSSFVDIILDMLKTAATVYAIVLVYKGHKCLADPEDKKVMLITALSLAAGSFAANLVGLI